MGQSVRKTPSSLKIAALIIIIIVAVVGIFAVLTAPETVLSFPVSFTVGVDVVRKEFTVQFLQNWVQVEVDVSRGSALWAARILSDNQRLWNYTAVQSGQTTYKSGWVQISSGQYNFTFSTVGFGSLTAQVTVTSKGGFW